MVKHCLGVIYCRLHASLRPDTKVQVPTFSRSRDREGPKIPKSVTRPELASFDGNYFVVGRLVLTKSTNTSNVKVVTMPV